MIAEQLKERIETMCSHITFDYRGKSCGVDPLSRTHYDMWYGDDTITVGSISEVMQAPFFNGNSLADISNAITNFEM